MTTGIDDFSDINGYQIIEKIYQGSKTEVYRAMRLSDCQAVAIKVLRQEYPSFNQLLQFRNQYTITTNLDIPSIVRPYNLELYRNGYILVMEFGGIPLQQYTKSQPLQLLEFFPIALQITDILDNLYQKRIIHKDIKPANILINPVTKQIKLIDFSIASLLPRETQSITNPNVLEGTLAYISPEQTGRMNRAIDYRSDFYALGITFFELLTGQLPFISDDPMELIHLHLAKQPPNISDINSKIPHVIAKIIHKLMAKNAEDRYQSAVGLKVDLEKCLLQLQEKGKIEDFEIARTDICDRVIIPEKLYGRENEVKELLATFERVSQGNSEMMLVTGFSGIGKTAVVNEVHKPIVKKRGYFIKGKFDQFNRNIPFSAFVQAFRDLMCQLLAESDKQLQQWQDKIFQALGENGQVIIEVIPELERVIGKQAPMSELSGAAAQNRFNLLFQKFIQVFTTKEHPLVIFLDDLQWADLASLKLMQLLIGEGNQGCLLLIGAYRDNEVSTAHPLILTLDDIKKTRTKINKINLKSLNQDELNQLVVDTLKCKENFAFPLSKLIYQKTKGNPFFATKFIKELHQSKLIKFNFQEGYWQCDIAEINQQALTNDVVEFMLCQLRRLPESTQQMLKLAACIGNEFDLETLAIISEQSQIETATCLWTALQETLILPTSDFYKIYVESENSTLVRDVPQTVTYKFLHDRIQQAAYSLIPEGQRQATHLKIGQLLLQKIPKSERESRIFEIVNQLNFAQKLLKQPSAKLQLVELNLIAGKKSKLSTAYGDAVQYFLNGIFLLVKDGWQSQYDLTLSLYENAAEVTYLNGNFVEMELYVAQVLDNGKSLQDKLKAYEVKLQGLKAQNKLKEAISFGLELLKLLGVELPNQPKPADIEQVMALRTGLQGKQIQDLIDLPEMTDSLKLAATRILVSLSPTAHMALPELLPMIAAKQVELALNYGNAPAHSHGYATWGMMLCGLFDDINAGYEYGQLALRLLDRLNTDIFRAPGILVATCFTQHWKDNVQTCLKPLLDAYSSALNTGDLEHASFSLQYYSHLAYFSGAIELSALAQQMQTYRDFIAQVKQETVLQIHQINLQAVLNLLGQAENPSYIIGQVYDEEKMLMVHLAANHRGALFYLHLHKLFLSYLFSDYAVAVDCAIETERYLDAGVGSLMVPVFHTYDSLIQLAIYPQVDLEQQQQILIKVAANQEKLVNWANHAPMNYLHKFDLVEAERYRILGQKATALEFYDRAINGAKKNGFLQEEALSNELAAKFYLEWNKGKVAAGYMQEAYYAYTHWGCLAKVKDLEKTYPQLLKPILQERKANFNTLDTFATITPTACLSNLDITSVLKTAQAISSIIDLDELISTLSKIILENAGAKKCVSILPYKDKWYIQAITSLSSDKNAFTTVGMQPLDDSQEVPLKLIQYVKHKLETVVIENCQSDIGGIIDEYMQKYQPKSVLCMPILNQGNLLGIIYLENHLAQGIFSSDRLLILNLLCTQAAISLENARLYANLQESQARFQRLADNVPGMIYQIHLNADGLPSIPYASSGSYNLYEATAEEIMAGIQNIRAMEHPDDIAGIDRAMMESSQNLTPFVYEWRIITPSGKMKWVQAISCPELQPDGAIIWDGFVFDISDRKKIEQAQARLLAILESATDIIGITDNQGNNLYLNQAGQEILGIPLEETDKFHISETIAPAMLEKIQAEALPTAIQTGSWSGESIVRSRNGKEIPVSQVIVIHKNDQGEVEFFSSIMRDISEAKRDEVVRKLIEAQLRQQTEDLEATLQKLKRTQAQMIQSEKMSSLGQLVAGVAHEINNPTNFIHGNLSYIEQYTQDLLKLLKLYQENDLNTCSEIQDLLDEIDLEFIQEDLPKTIKSMKVGTERICEIVLSLRTFSRMDEAEFKEVNVHEGIDSTLMILQHRLKEKAEFPAIEVIKNYGNLPSVQCYAGQLNQVFMNILVNAIEAIEEKNSKCTIEEIQANPNQITIRTAVVDSNWIEIAIADNGIGMSEQVQKQILNPFFTTKPVGKGTGMGMSISYQIITERHDGKLQCFSTLNQGTEFVIKIPIRQ
jgi:PAS domain S-box-containing protein